MTDKELLFHYRIKQYEEILAIILRQARKIHLFYKVVGINGGIIFLVSEKEARIRT
jgi:hypothetical protein